MTGQSPRFVVGFDLDMTLVDSRPGIRAVYQALSAETGVPIDAAAAASRLGPPLEEELACWFRPDAVAPAADRFRALYPSLAITLSPSLPGAGAAIGAVRAVGGDVVVITAKYEPNARLHLDHLGLGADHVLGWCWAQGKTEALLTHGVAVYVGDHVADVRAAVDAGVVAVGVATGASTADELLRAGAAVTLTDLTQFPRWLGDHVLQRRLAVLDAHLAALGSVAVAFSGGADSAFLLAAATRVLGAGQVVAVTAVSSSLPAAELAAARRFAAGLGVRHLTPQTHELDVVGYRSNAGDRCYFCKAELMDVLRPVAQAASVLHVATGTNADDAAAGFRPGMRAAAERGVVTPLLDAGLTKDQVRLASRQLGLVTWDKPAAACLSSRIAFGIEVTRPRLQRVERAEQGLRRVLEESGSVVRDLRVRDLGDTARIELDAELVSALRLSSALQDLAVAAVCEAGFTSAEVDARGFRSGAMNELLADPDRYR